MRVVGMHDSAEKTGPQLKPKTISMSTLRGYGKVKAVDMQQPQRMATKNKCMLLSTHHKWMVI